VVEDSPTWRAFTGQTYEEWRDSGWLHAVHPDDRKRVAQAWRETVAKKASIEIDCRVRHLSGEWRWMTARATPVFDAHGTLKGYVGMNTDVTERKRAEEAVRRLAAIVEASDDAIVGKDLNGVITSWNKGAERLFGYSGEEAIGKPVTMLIPADRHGEEAAILERIRRGEHVDHYETIRQRKDGSLVEISLSVSPIKIEGRVIGASKIARDITERKRAQDALRESEQRLSAIFAQRDGGYCRDGRDRALHYSQRALLRHFRPSSFSFGCMISPIPTISRRTRRCSSAPSRTGYLSKSRNVICGRTDHRFGSTIPFSP
jgi:two-component system NtrC family sensor kinase